MELVAQVMRGVEALETTTALCFLPPYADAICLGGRVVNGASGLTIVRELAWWAKLTWLGWLVRWLAEAIFRVLQCR